MTKLTKKDWRTIVDALQRAAKHYDADAERLAKYMLATEHERRASADQCRVVLAKIEAGDSSIS